MLPRDQTKQVGYCTCRSAAKQSRLYGFDTSVKCEVCMSTITCSMNYYNGSNRCRRLVMPSSNCKSIILFQGIYMVACSLTNINNSDIDQLSTVPKHPLPNRNIQPHSLIHRHLPFAVTSHNLYYNKCLHLVDECICL